ncbi:MAG TPA: efflux RND transporter periplasmic adaptor subunit [Steroidobacteraceae bacterium]|nr:efflux RND transporter periplasmic adaptor subunit [Steroidobacteraceae bacterium]
MGVRRLTITRLAIAAALLAGALLGWWATHRTAPATYLTAEVTRGPIARTVTATGTVNPQLTVIVGSYVSGVIRDVYCDYNTRVKRGQLCATIDPRPYQAALDQARGSLARDTGQLEGARSNLARYEGLRKQSYVAEQTYENEKALVHQLEGSIQMDRAAVRNAEVNLGYTRIVSPVDGTVVARNITVGQTVAASFQTPTLFLIATDLTRMQVDTNVSESDIGAIETGDPARLTVEAFDRAFPGKVAQIRQAPQVVQNVVTYDVVVEVANPSLLLKPGMTATVNIITDQRSDVVRVPDQALRFTPDGAGTAAGKRVWMLTGDGPKPVSVRTGLDDDTHTEITAGDLTPGMRVIVGEQRAAQTAAYASPFRIGH